MNLAFASSTAIVSLPINSQRESLIVIFPLLYAEYLSLVPSFAFSCFTYTVCICPSGFGMGPTNNSFQKVTIPWPLPEKCLSALQNQQLRIITHPSLVKEKRNGQSSPPNHGPSSHIARAKEFVLSVVNIFKSKSTLKVL